MKRVVFGMLVLGLTVLLTGCTYYTLAEAEKTVKVADAISVKPQTAWSRHVDGKREDWTIDGPALQQLSFRGGLKDGEGFDKTSEANKSKETALVFRKDMTPLDIAEMFQARMERSGFEKVQVDDLRPAKFGGVGGFRFEFTFVTKSGLAKQGMAIGAVHKERLYMAVYQGTALHYYDKHKEDAERILATVKLL